MGICQSKLFPGGYTPDPQEEGKEEQGRDGQKGDEREGQNGMTKEAKTSAYTVGSVEPRVGKGGTI